MAKKNYDVIRSSKELKKIIVQLEKEKDLSIFAVCKDIGIDYSSFRSFLNSKNPEAVRGVYTSDVVKFCKAIGIEVRLTITINGNYDLDRFKKENQEWQRYYTTPRHKPEQ